MNLKLVLEVFGWSGFMGGMCLMFYALLSSYQRWKYWLALIVFTSAAAVLVFGYLSGFFT